MKPWYSSCGSYMHENQILFRCISNQCKCMHRNTTTQYTIAIVMMITLGKNIDIIIHIHAINIPGGFFNSEWFWWSWWYWKSWLHLKVSRKDWAKLVGTFRECNINLYCTLVLINRWTIMGDILSLIREGLKNVPFRRLFSAKGEARTFTEN